MTQLLAGAAMVDITPAKGIQLAGDTGRPRPVESVRAAAHAHCVVLRMGATTLCVISCDTLGIARAQGDPLRREIAGLLGTTPEHVVLHSTQTHSGPFVGHQYIRNKALLPGPEYQWMQHGSDEYIQPFHEAVVRGVKEALSRLRPARLKGVRGIDARISFCRRFVFRGDWAGVHPGTCWSEILHPESFADPEVGIAVFEDVDSGKAIAALLHHTCHPCHGISERYVDPDWPGHWGRGMQELLGKECVPVCINGACGDVHHMNHMDPSQKDTLENMVGMLMETSRRVLPQLKDIPVESLGLTHRWLELEQKPLTATMLAEARHYVATHPEPIWDAKHESVEWDWIYPRTLLDLEEIFRKEPTFRYEIQVLRIGGFALVSWPGEPFVEGQLAVKSSSPAELTFVAHYCNEPAGYLPHRRAFEKARSPSFDLTISPFSKIAAGGLEAVVTTTQDMLTQAFR